ncbi:MAG: hypothetical protein J3K34DRAFT_493233 [Monoraphidium minutum]|nr:MAG: hypothetical protein J3K34DRAFT_493233 [Monoraphidium minutum]
MFAGGLLSLNHGSLPRADESARGRLETVFGRAFRQPALQHDFYEPPGALHRASSCPAPSALATGKPRSPLRRKRSVRFNLEVEELGPATRPASIGNGEAAAALAAAAAARAAGGGGAASGGDGSKRAQLESRLEGLLAAGGGGSPSGSPTAGAAAAGFSSDPGRPPAAPRGPAAPRRPAVSALTLAIHSAASRGPQAEAVPPRPEAAAAAPAAAEEGEKIDRLRQQLEGLWATSRSPPAAAPHSFDPTAGHWAAPQPRCGGNCDEEGAPVARRAAAASAAAESAARELAAAAAAPSELQRGGSDASSDLSGDPEGAASSSSSASSSDSFDDAPAPPSEAAPPSKAQARVSDGKHTIASGRGQRGVREGASEGAGGDSRMRYNRQFLGEIQGMGEKRLSHSKVTRPGKSGELSARRWPASEMVADTLNRHSAASMMEQRLRDSLKGLGGATAARSAAALQASRGTEDARGGGGGGRDAPARPSRARRATPLRRAEPGTLSLAPSAQSAGGATAGAPARQPQSGAAAGCKGGAAHTADKEKAEQLRRRLEALLVIAPPAGADAAPPPAAAPAAAAPATALAPRTPGGEADAAPRAAPHAAGLQQQPGAAPAAAHAAPAPALAGAPACAPAKAAPNSAETHCRQPQAHEPSAPPKAAAAAAAAAPDGLREAAAAAPQGAAAAGSPAQVPTTPNLRARAPASTWAPGGGEGGVAAAAPAGGKRDGKVAEMRVRLEAILQAQAAASCSGGGGGRASDCGGGPKVSELRMKFQQG